MKVSGISNLVMAAGGGFHTVALTTSVVVHACGYNRHRQLRDRTTTNCYTPVKVSNLSGAVTVAVEVDHSIATARGLESPGAGRSQAAFLPWG